MEELTDYSLQFLTSVKVAISLWTHEDIHDLVYNIDFTNLRRKDIFNAFLEIRDIVAARSHRLPVPNALQKKVLQCVNGVAWQIYSFYEHDLRFGHLSVRELYWTAEGTIDKKKSVEAFVSNEIYPSSARFRVACMHCMEDKIVEFLENTSIPYQAALMSEIRYQKYRTMMNYWLDRMRAKISVRGLNGCDEYYVFMLAATTCHELACRYLWVRRKEHQQPDKLVMSCIPSAMLSRQVSISRMQRSSDAIFFFLSETNKNRRDEMFSLFPVGLLKCYLDWPHQQYFMQNLYKYWKCLSQSDWMSLVNEIIYKTQAEFDDYDYHTLFLQCLAIMPASVRSHIFTCVNVKNEFVMKYLLNIGDIASIITALKRATKDLTENVFFYPESGHFCVKLAIQCKWDSLYHYIKSCIVPRSGLEERVKFKTKVTSFFLDCLFRMELTESQGIMTRILDIVQNVMSK